MKGQKKLMHKVEKLLHKRFRGSKVVMDRTQERIFGTLVWKGFASKDQIDRQEEVWDFLLKELSDEEQSQIAAILTAIPAELSHA